VIFAGMRRDIPELLSILDVFVLPSLNEGLPMALLEAQGARIPVVATCVGAIPDVLEDRVTGILIPPKDPQAIAEAIIMILSDEKFASGIAQKGFERVRDNFSSEKMGDKYLSIYKELIEGTGCWT
jgi:glycosyltransferase involved in cell wall biosynthesis